MPDYTRSIDIGTSPEKAFAFVSDIANLPRYVPTTRSATETGQGKVHVEGVSGGHDYADDGHIYIDRDQRLMRWGSGESAYRGELSIGPAPAGSHIEITLHFHAAPAGEVDIEKSLDNSLRRLEAELA